MKTIIQHGKEYMRANEKGEIYRPEIGMKNPSGQWRIVGAVERNNFGAAVRFYPLERILESPETIPWMYKNGKQRVFIRDFDHGSLREWASPGHCVFRGD